MIAVIFEAQPRAERKGAYLDAAERLRQHALVVGSDVEIIHRPRQVEIGVGIETLDEG